jgi:hypothetical protein
MSGSHSTRPELVEGCARLKSFRELNFQGDFDVSRILETSK